jgi:hypothetical protein
MLHHAVMSGARTVLPLMALQRGASPSLAGVLIAVQALAPAVLSLPIATWIARWGARRIAAWGLALSAALLLGLAPVGGVAVLFVLAAGVGVGYSMTGISAQRVLGQCVAAGDARAYERFSLATAISACAGPLVAGALLTVGGETPCLAGLGTLALMAGPLLAPAWLDGPVQSLDPHAGVVRSSIGAGVRSVLAAETVISLSWNALATLVILRAHAEAWPASQLTLVVSLLGFGVLLARLLGPRLLPGLTEAALVRVSMAAAMLGLLSFAGHWPWWVHAVAQTLAGMGLGLSLSPVLSLLHQRSNPATHTRTLALRNLMLQGCAVAGPALMGTAVGLVGTAPTCVAMVAVALAAAMAIRL